MEFNNGTIETAGNTFEQLSHTGQNGIILAGVLFFVTMFFILLYFLYKTNNDNHKSNAKRIDRLEEDKDRCAEDKKECQKMLARAVKKIDETSERLDDCYGKLSELKQTKEEER